MRVRLKDGTVREVELFDLPKFVKEHFDEIEQTKNEADIEAFAAFVESFKDRRDLYRRLSEK